ncbi:hypothetical protein [Winogradskyella sp. A3E31]|uniref:hypothetical protein n=1 Tax=Winogradskyella sp. A3E31 TaxID=3349637 RepID=UPI00398B7F13
MSENSKPTPQNEEVDLGQLFKMIGNAFQKLFDFIASIFKGLFHVLILILAHFFKRLKWYALAGFVGLAIGWYLDKSSDKLYGANMFIETNFNSSFQVYENIKNLNELAYEEGDSVQLANILGIDISSAAKLKGFYIEPDIDPNRSIQMFSMFYQALDSVTQSKTTYKEYIESLNVHNFKVHKIGVASTDKDIYPKLRGKISKVLSENEYLMEVLQVNQENIDRNISTLERQEEELDTLISRYLEIRIKESDKEAVSSSGTILNMGDAQENKLLVNEAPLLKEKLDLERQIRDLQAKKVEEKNIISVVSDFPATGYDIQVWYQKSKILLPLVFIVITMLIFSLVGLGRFVENYQNSK